MAVIELQPSHLTTFINECDELPCGSTQACESRGSLNRKGADPAEVAADQLAPEELQQELLARHITCGALWPAGPSGKRQVWSDGVIMIRVSATSDVLVNAVKDELYWARRIGNAVAAQLPLFEPLVISDWTVTLWQWLDGEPATARNAAAHGGLLRRLHDHGGQPPSDVEAVDQLTSARARLSSITNRATQHRLSDMVEHAAEILDQAASGQLVLSHGDAHDRNLLVVGGVL